MLCDTSHFRESSGRNLALKECVHCFNRLEFKLNVGLGINLIKMNKPIIRSVYNIMHSDFSALSLRIKCADLNNGVHFFVLLFKRRNILRNYLDKRQCGIEKYFIGIKLFFCMHLINSLSDI